MEIKEIIEGYLPKIREHYLPLLLMALGFVLLSGGLIYSLNANSGKPSDDIQFESGETVKDKNIEQKITIDVEGAVINPGIYSLSSSSRIKDALIAAGGLSSGADREWMEKNLNLALKLSDSAKIYIPRIGDPSAGSGQEGVVSVSGLININSASSSELDSLPGIGPITAQKIIDNRPYSSIEDLKSKKIVGQSVFDKIKDKIGVY